MSAYNRKLLELKNIENKFDKYFLKIRLSFEQDIEIYLEIDKYTAESLYTVTQFDGKHRYRLSFNNSLDSTKKQYTSILTRTYCEESNLIYFSCSQDYINNLNIIKHCQHINDVYKLGFISADLTPIVEHQDEERQKRDEKNMHPKFIRKFTQTSVAVMNSVLVMLFLYLSGAYLNNTQFEEKALAQSIQLDNEVFTKQQEFLVQNDKVISEDISSNQIDIPFIELDQDITYNIPEGSVALTFDDGPSQYSMEIMDVLKKYGVGGTFFFTGLNAKKYPDYVQYIESNGYSIGSHSMNHTNMPTTSYDKQKNELIQSIEVLEEITNRKITLFRPPYGSFNKQMKNLAFEHQYKIVLWNNDPEDWKTRDADKIFNDIKNSNVSGSIILLHESQAVIDALPNIIKYLQELDLEITSLQ